MGVLLYFYLLPNFCFSMARTSQALSAPSHEASCQAAHPLLSAAGSHLARSNMPRRGEEKGAAWVRKTVESVDWWGSPAHSPQPKPLNFSHTENHLLRQLEPWQPNHMWHFSDGRGDDIALLLLCQLRLSTPSPYKSQDVTSAVTAGWPQLWDFHQRRLGLADVHRLTYTTPSLLPHPPRKTSPSQSAKAMGRASLLSPFTWAGTTHIPSICHGK